MQSSHGCEYEVVGTVMKLGRLPDSIIRVVGALITSPVTKS